MGLDLDIVFAEPNYNYQPPETRQSSQAFVDQSSQAFVDGSAPGVNLYSAFPGNRWAWWSGTSFAAPLVSGEAALLLALNPGLSRSEVRNVITRARIDPNPLNPAYTRKLGQVRIDFLLAVTWR
jgi:subtilisin family serine protease